MVKSATPTAKYFNLRIFAKQKPSQALSFGYQSLAGSQGGGGVWYCITVRYSTVVEGEASQHTHISNNVHNNVSARFNKIGRITREVS